MLSFILMQNSLFVFIALIPILDNTLFKCSPEIQMRIFIAHCFMIGINSVYGALLLLTSKEVIDH